MTDVNDNVSFYDCNDSFEDKIESEAEDSSTEDHIDVDVRDILKHVTYDMPTDPVLKQRWILALKKLASGISIAAVFLRYHYRLVRNLFWPVVVLAVEVNSVS